MPGTRLPHFIDPDRVLAGHYQGERGRIYVAHVPGADEIELKGCFAAPELRRFADVLEGKRA